MTTLTAEAEYFLNITEQWKKFCSSLHCNGSNSYLFFNGVKKYQLKAKGSEFFNYPVFVRNISKEFSIGDMKQTGLNGYMHDFSVDCGNIDVGNILDI